MPSNNFKPISIDQAFLDMKLPFFCFVLALVPVFGTLLAYHRLQYRVSLAVLEKLIRIVVESYIMYDSTLFIRTRPFTLLL